MTRIQIKKLKLKGLTKDYDFSFKPGLNIIAGPISTGKTSILEFIDYCFGATSHPEHIEIQRKVRTVLLEIELNGETIVIERSLFSSERKATLHECLLGDMDQKHVTKVVQTRQMPGQESLSSYFLEKLGLWGVSLKEAPTKDSSNVDMMSFRDVMWYCFMPHERLDSKDLLFEKVPIKKIKLNQVFDVIFKVHANELAQLGFQIKSVESEINRLKGEIKTLTNFLNESNIPSRDKLEEQLDNLSKSESELKIKLTEITQTLKGESDIAKQLRMEYSKIDDDIRQLLAIKRDRETLLKRLLPLRGQYSEDTKKLRFLQEAKTVLNPLGLVSCPYCFEKISESSDMDICNLCGEEVKSESDETFDIKKEIRSIETKLRELNSFIQDTDQELREIESAFKEKSQTLQDIRKRLDEALKEYVSPYISERDSIVGELNRIRQEIQGIQSQLELHNNIEERINKKSKLESALESKQTELESERQKVKNREELIQGISNRFGDILASANFPKLENPKMDSNLVPSVRGLPYYKIGSSGAMTLISVSWFLSIFEKSIEHDGHHPGFIMIDSPQKNIGIRANEDDPEFRDTKIVEGLYRHLIEKTKEFGSEVQILIVDNEPPQMADEFINIRFTRRKDTPPYGLIDDELE